MIKVRKFIMKLETHLKLPKFLLNIKMQEEGIDTGHHGKNKDLMKYIICDEENCERGRPLPWLIYH